MGSKKWGGRVTAKEEAWTSGDPEDLEVSVTNWLRDGSHLLFSLGLSFLACWITRWHKRLLEIPTLNKLRVYDVQALGI